MRTTPRLLLGAALSVAPLLAHAQGFRSADPVIRQMWQVGMNESQLERLAQVLIDSIGPRLSGTPGFTNATNWLERTYTGFGIPVRQERYGTWRGWQSGAVTMQLITPRQQNLDVELLAWSLADAGWQGD